MTSALKKLMDSTSQSIDKVDLLRLRNHIIDTHSNEYIILLIGLLQEVIDIRAEDVGIARTNAVSNEEISKPMTEGELFAQF